MVDGTYASKMIGRGSENAKSLVNHIWDIFNAWRAWSLIDCIGLNQRSYLLLTKQMHRVVVE